MKIFVADIHLTPEANQTNEAFKAFLDGPAQKATELYILGDLFDAWIGDDVGLQLFAESVSWLKAYSERIPTFFLPGNRDFLIGKDFYQATGITPIPDPHRLQLGTKTVLLKHADDLCTDDVDYQAFRQLSRSPEWQQEFLAKTPQERISIAQQLRSQSQESTQEKSMDIMDVNSEAFSMLMNESSAEVLIHGHTHRPKTHTLVNGLRIDVGDWSKKGGHYLVADSGQFELFFFKHEDQ